MKEKSHCNITNLNMSSPMNNVNIIITIGVLMLSILIHHLFKKKPCLTFGWRHSEPHGERPQLFMVQASSVEEARKFLIKQHKASMAEIEEIENNLPSPDEYEKKRGTTKRERALMKYFIKEERSSDLFQEIRFGWTVPFFDEECLTYVLDNPPDFIAGKGRVLACSASDQ